MKKIVAIIYVVVIFFPLNSAISGEGSLCHWVLDYFEGDDVTEWECKSHCRGNSNARNCEYNRWFNGLGECTFEKKKCVKTTTISAGTRIQTNKSYYSPNVGVRLVALENGNLILQEGGINNTLSSLFGKIKGIIWLSGTNNGSPNRTVFQKNGNLVVYKNNSGEALWSSKTAGNPDAVLHITNDRKLKIVKNGIKWERP